MRYKAANITTPDGGTVVAELSTCDILDIKMALTSKAIELNSKMEFERAKVYIDLYNKLDKVELV